jgi:hypothetical protein
VAVRQPSIMWGRYAVAGDLTDLVAAGEPPGGLQLQLLVSLSVSGRRWLRVSFVAACCQAGRSALLSPPSPVAGADTSSSRVWVLVLSIPTVRSGRYQGAGSRGASGLREGGLALFVCSDRTCS